MSRRKPLHITFLLLLALQCYAIALAAQEQPRFRVMWWNVENLFDTQHDTLKNDWEFLPEGIRHWNYNRYRAKLNNVARVITAVGEWTSPVLVGLCEVENNKVLRDLTQYSPLSEHGYKYVMTHSPDERGINVALLYQPHRFKLLAHQSIRINFIDKRSRPTRDILHVCGELLNNDTLDILVCHFPSRSGGVSSSEPNRIFVAEKARALADSLMDIRQRPKLILMGDLNDYPSNTSIVRTLGAKAPPAHPTGRTLYHLLARQARQRNFGSYKYQGQWGLLDHLIVSGTLLERSNSIYTSEAWTHVFRPTFMLTTDDKTGGVQPLRTYVGMKYQGGYSDHLPLYMDFHIKEFE